MARPRKSVPSMYYHRGTRYWCVTLDGKRVYLSRDRTEAERKYLERIAARLAGKPAAPAPPVVPAALTLGEALARYGAHLKASGADGRALRRLKAAGRACARLADLPARDFGPRRLKDVRAALAGREARGPGGTGLGRTLSRLYVAHLVGALKACFRWLASEEEVPASQANALALVGAATAGPAGLERPPVLPPAPGAVEACLPHLHPTLRALVVVQRASGMRPGEACRMRRGEVSCSPAEVVAVPVGGGKEVPVSAVSTPGGPAWVYAPRRHKGSSRGKPRVVALGPVAQAALAPLLEGLSPDEYVFSPRRAVAALRRERGQRLRVPRSRAPGEHYTPESYCRAVRKACRKAGAEPFHPHQLRHEAATLASNATDTDTAQAVLGHCSPDMTAHYTAQLLAKAAAYAARAG